jgi:hypothetical protein
LSVLGIPRGATGGGDRLAVLLDLSFTSLLGRDFVRELERLCLQLRPQRRDLRLLRRAAVLQSQALRVQLGALRGRLGALARLLQLSRGPISTPRSPAYTSRIANPKPLI